MLSKPAMLIVLLAALFSLGFGPVSGVSGVSQDDLQTNSNTIVIEGPIQAITANVLTVANVDFALDANDPLLATLQVGTVVQVTSHVGATTDLAGLHADSVVVTGSNIISPIITLQGPVQAVNVNIVTIFSLNIQFNPDAPILTTLNPGDVLEVSGNILTISGTNIIIPAQVVIILHNPPPEATPEASVDVKKYVSSDGTTWNNADSAPGLEVGLGTPLTFRFVVTNTSQVELTTLTLTDNVYDLSSCTIPPSLSAGAFFECTIGPVPAQAGQHMDTATVHAMAGDQGVPDSDSAYYFGGDRPSINVEKSVSTDNASWQAADTAPGLDVKADSQVFFRFIVTNNGNVPLAGITLSDDAFDTSSCMVPAALNPGTGFACIIGPFPVTNTHTDTATASATFQGISVTDTDSANYTVNQSEGEGPVTIVIEGPVQAINVNIITIFGIHIEVEPGNPILTQIHVGDVIRVEGTSTAQGNTVIIVAVNIVIINVYGNNNNNGGNAGGPAVPPPPQAGFSKDDCKKGGWQNLTRADGSGFKNQGDCIQYVNTGK